MVTDEHTQALPGLLSLHALLLLLAAVSARSSSLQSFLLSDRVELDIFVLVVGSRHSSALLRMYLFLLEEERRAREGKG
jgi:hypothetical protein